MSEELKPELEWHWSTDEEGPMTPCGTGEVMVALEHAIYESGMATFGEELATIFLCRFRPYKLNGKRLAERLLEWVDEVCCEVDGRDRSFVAGTDDEVLAKVLEAVIKTDALVAVEDCQFDPSNEKYQAALKFARASSVAAAPTESK